MIRLNINVKCFSYKGIRFWNNLIFFFCCDISDCGSVYSCLNVYGILVSIFIDFLYLEKFFKLYKLKN